MGDRPAKPENDFRPQGNKVTITDVAKAAGVSKTLVSFILNGRSDVSVATKQRVQDVIAELGYRPNRQARLLGQRKTGIVGLAMKVRAYTDLMVLTFIAALGERLAEHDYGLLLLTHSKKEPLEIVTAAVEDRMVDGLVLMDVLHVDPRVKLLEKCGFPYMLYSSNDDSLLHYVDVNYDEAARLVVDRLWEQGHRQICLLTGPVHYRFSFGREESFRRAVVAKGLQLDEHHCFRGDFTEGSGWEIGKRLAALERRPTALFSVTDMMAIGAIHGLIAGGVHLPRDMAVIGFGNSPIASGVHPALTTVHLPNAEMGYAAAEVIVARIDGKEHGGPYIFMPHLVVRESG
jgi:DNA-binding LacI/PurR family transcriptional regulator